VPAESSVSADDLRSLARQIYQVDLAAVSELYAETVFKVRDLGVAFSDRRAIKVMKLLAASAVLCGRLKAQASDLWVLRYVWDREEQIGPLASLVNGILEQHRDEERTHPLAAVPERVDAEELAGHLNALEQECEKDHLSLTALARLRERATDLA